MNRPAPQHPVRPSTRPHAHSPARAAASTSFRASLANLKLHCAQFRMDYLLAFTDTPWETQIREVLRRTKS